MSLRGMIFLALVFVPLVGGFADDNWPRFRGPNGAGISATKTVPVKWTDDDIR